VVGEGVADIHIQLETPGRECNVSDRRTTYE